MNQRYVVLMGDKEFSYVGDLIRECMRLLRETESGNVGRKLRRFLTSILGEQGTLYQVFATEEEQGLTAYQFNQRIVVAQSIFQQFRFCASIDELELVVPLELTEDYDFRIITTGFRTAKPVAEMTVKEMRVVLEVIAIAAQVMESFSFDRDGVTKRINERFL